MSAGAAPHPGELLWRCRRGMKELDVLLERYVGRRGSWPEAERRAFARLLDLADPQLAAYLFGHEHPADPELAGLVRSIAGEDRRGGARP
jgi:antitoxin CptB